jgi:cytoskeletal protein CcmA (bactofilin family)
VDNDGNNIASILSESTIEGNIAASSDLIIHGKIIGDVISDSLVIIGSDAEIYGSVTAKEISIYGKVFGDIAVNDIIILKGKSIVNGDIFASEIVCEKSCEISGQVSIVSGKENIQERIQIGEVTRSDIKDIDYKDFPKIMRIENNKGFNNYFNNWKIL